MVATLSEAGHGRRPSIAHGAARFVDVEVVEVGVVLVTGAVSKHLERLGSIDREPDHRHDPTLDLVGDLRRAEWEVRARTRPRVVDGVADVAFVDDQRWSHLLARRSDQCFAFRSGQQAGQHGEPRRGDQHVDCDDATVVNELIVEEVRRVAREITHRNECRPSKSWASPALYEDAVRPTPPLDRLRGDDTRSSGALEAELSDLVEVGTVLREKAESVFECGCGDQCASIGAGRIIDGISGRT